MAVKTFAFLRKGLIIIKVRRLAICRERTGETIWRVREVSSQCYVFLTWMVLAQKLILKVPLKMYAFM